MKRFVSYLYSIYNNQKIHNSGFARIELRTGRNRIDIHLQESGYTGKTGTVYLFVRKKENIQGISIGTITFRNNQGDFRYEQPEENIGQTPWRIMQMNGIAILIDNQITFLSQWDEEPVDTTRFQVWDIKKEEEAAKRQNNNGAQQEEEAAKRQNGNVAQQEEEAAKRQQNSNVAQQEEEAAKRQNSNRAQPAEETITSATEDAGHFADALPVQNVQDAVNTMQPGQNLQQRQIRQGYMAQYAGNQILQNQNMTQQMAQSRQMGQNMPRQMTNGQQQFPNVQQPRVQNQPLSPQQPKKGQLQNPQQLQMDQPQNLQQPQMDQPQNPQQLQMSQPQNLQQSQMQGQPQKAQQSLMGQPQMQGQLQKTQQPRNMPQIQPYSQTIPQSQNIQQGQPITLGHATQHIGKVQPQYETIPQAHAAHAENETNAQSELQLQNQGIMQNLPVQKGQVKYMEGAEQKERETQKTQAVQPEQEVQQPNASTIHTAELCPQPDTPHWEQTWRYMLRVYPVLNQFAEKDNVLCVRIEIKDVRLLPDKYWSVVNNSFLLHGFFNYRYLIFGKIGQNWMIGIPGVYQNQEHVMASVFGFPDFLAQEQKNERGEQPGYWYRILDI